MQLRNRLRVGIDADGVCYRFVDSTNEWLRQTGRQIIDPQWVGTWPFYRAWGVTDAQWPGVFADGVKAGVIFSPAFTEPNAAVVLDALAERHELHLITSRNIPGAISEARAATWRWVAELGVPFASVTITSDKGAVDTDVIIDDMVDVCEGLLAETDTRPFLMARPWNAGNRQGLEVVTSLEEFAGLADSFAHVLASGARRYRCEVCHGEWTPELVDLGLAGVCQPRVSAAGDARVLAAAE